MRIGFIGLGIMGNNMALNLLKGGHELIVYNRSKSKASNIINHGALWADGLYKMADVDVMFTMLAHPEAVTEMATSARGFLQFLKAGAYWVDSSTVNPNFSREMGSFAHARGVNFLDAPVGGSRLQAQNGDLAFFIGGDTRHIEHCRPCFELMGKKVLHVGGIGMGTSLKLIVNLLLATSMATFSESVALGLSLGLNQKLIFDVLIGAPVTAPFLSTKREKIESGSYPPDFAIKMMTKDVRMVLSAAHDAHIELPLASTIKRLYQSAAHSGIGEEDFSSIFKFVCENIGN